MSDSKTVTTEREQGLELALQLMGGMSDGLAKTTNTLIDNLTAERDELEATLKAIREGVSELYDGPYMPSPAAVLRALWPSNGNIDQYRRPTDE